MPPLPPALSVANLSVLARDRPLVSDVSFEIGVGESLAVLGASGSGKTLVAAAVLGSLGPEFEVEGQLRIFGQPPATGPGRGAVAAIFQNSDSALNPLVTVGRQLAVPIAQANGLGRVDAAVAAERLLCSVGIEEPHRVLAGFPAELSGGQRQRVCIALALACRARLLVADEPTTALDVVSQARVIDVLRCYGITERAALMFITHDLAVASSLCDRALVLQAGRVIERSAMSSLIAEPVHAFTRELVRAAAAADGCAVAA